MTNWNYFRHSFSVRMTVRGQLWEQTTEGQVPWQGREEVAEERTSRPILRDGSPRPRRGVG